MLIFLLIFSNFSWYVLIFQCWMIDLIESAFSTAEEALASWPNAPCGDHKNQYFHLDDLATLKFDVHVELPPTVQWGFWIHGLSGTLGHVSIIPIFFSFSSLTCRIRPCSQEKKNVSNLVWGPHLRFPEPRWADSLILTTHVVALPPSTNTPIFPCFFSSFFFYLIQ